ncbi:hypothetical protein JOE61_003038 [Nocardioides salarius]|uniref:Sulfotransferase domain-containing protein n=1 Tax=Nocardioides salarius TaxID=374513 RepID=A0ABS2MDF3_9ACTN|nr:sulfotransferase [Nocardioides salarius]MBM7509224.1 hypothetical protein [Nocardioides salarius]
MVDEVTTRRVPYTVTIAGVQKAATSTLYSLLARHPRVAGGGSKEVHYFDDETRDWSRPAHGDYHAVAEKERQRFGVDATPSYLFWPGAMRRIAAYDPQMRVILSLRDPIERAFSQWSMTYGRRAGDHPAFAELVESSLAMGDVSRGGPAGVSNGQLRKRSLVQRGLYGAQLREALLHLPREQFLVMDFRDVVGDLTGAARRMTTFLGLPPFKKAAPALSANPSRSNLVAPPVTGALVRRLAEIYADDLALLATEVDLDVAAWSTSRVLAGSLDPDDLAERLNRKAGLVQPAPPGVRPATP